MGWVGAGLVALGGQLLLGALICAGMAWVVRRATLLCPRTRRRLVVRWGEAARALVRAAPWALGLSVAGFVLHVVFAGLDAGLGFWFRPGWFVVLSALPGTGAYLVLHAGSRERRGQLRGARREVRLGGLSMLPGILSLLVLVWADLLMTPPFRRSFVAGPGPGGVVLLVGMVTLVCAGFVGAVAGLAGKARPSGGFAALFYVLGWACLVGAWRLVSGG